MPRYVIPQRTFVEDQPPTRRLFWLNMSGSTACSHSYQPRPKGEDEITATDAVFGRTVVPVPNPNKEPKKDKLGERADRAREKDVMSNVLHRV